MIIYECCNCGCTFAFYCYQCPDCGRKGPFELKRGDSNGIAKP